eukprot:11642649-Alexandrium_andersonii.AAC.1
MSSDGEVAPAVGPQGTLLQDSMEELLAVKCPSLGMKSSPGLPAEGAEQVVGDEVEEEKEEGK